MSQHIEQTILSNLISNESFTRKVIPFLKSDYFSKPSEKIVFNEIHEFITKYNSLPTKEALVINLGSSTKIRDNELTEAMEVIDEITLKQEKSEEKWLLNTTEKFCQEKAIYNAVYESIQILDNKDKHQERGAIPDLLSTALGVCFDGHIGHDYLETSDERFDFYHRKLNRIPFDLEYFNKITGGGTPPKTLNIIMAGTNVGKSLMMCHMAAANLSMGYNVLYITLEMSEEETAKRIDANLLNIAMDDLMAIPKETYQQRVDSLKSKTTGKLIIKEYATASAGALHFKHLLNELYLKKNFRPHIIYLDYLNLCLSARIKAGSNVNSYTYVKAIAEEVRGMAVEFDVPIWSATQLNRSGFTDSDPGLEDTAESFGLPATADFTIVAIASEEMDQLHQLLIKQLKSRYGDPNVNKRFIIGVDKPKMRLYDVDPTAQKNITASGQKPNSMAGGRNGKTKDEFVEQTKRNDGNKFNKDFSGIKV